MLRFSTAGMEKHVLMDMYVAKDVEIKALNETIKSLIETNSANRSMVHDMKRELRKVKQEHDMLQQRLFDALVLNHKLQEEMKLFFARLVKPCDAPAEGTCPTCIEPFASKTCSQLPCSHIFHTECAQEWCKNPESGRACPVCRKHMAASTGIKRPLADAAAE